MTQKLASCSNCHQQKEFYGISHRLAGGFNPETGEPLIEQFFWRQCTFCLLFSQEDENGKTISLQKNEPPKELFKPPREVVEDKDEQQQQKSIPRQRAGILAGQAIGR